MQTAAVQAIFRSYRQAGAVAQQLDSKPGLDMPAVPAAEQPALLAATHHLLRLTALSPVDLAYMESLLSKGVVALRFFEFSNPVGVFALRVGSAEHKALVEAVQANRCSPMYAAALRVLRHRSQRAVDARRKREDRRLESCRQTLQWPSRDDYARDAAAAEARYTENVRVLNERRRAIRDVRARRIAVLAAHATAPGLADWRKLAAEVAAITAAPLLS